MLFQCCYFGNYIFFWNRQIYYIKKKLAPVQQVTKRVRKRNKVHDKNEKENNYILQARKWVARPIKPIITALRHSIFDPREDLRFDVTHHCCRVNMEVLKNPVTPCLLDPPYTDHRISLPLIVLPSPSKFNDIKNI